jgi:hypothetical protein
MGSTSFLHSLRSAGGTYAFLASAAPVPEPAAVALMLAGLAAVGLVVRRRRPG